MAFCFPAQVERLGGFTLASCISRRSKVHKFGGTKETIFIFSFFPKKLITGVLQSCPRACLKNDKFKACLLWLGSFPEPPYILFFEGRGAEDCNLAQSSLHVNP